MQRTKMRVVGTALVLVLVLMFNARTAAAQEQGAHLNVKADAYVTGSWNGILFIIDDSAGFQIRVGTRTEGADFLDGDHTNPFLTGLEDLFDDSAKKKRANHPSHT